MFLTRAVLARPGGRPDGGRRLSASLEWEHRLIWSLFPPDGTSRDFLYRAAGPDHFLILSARPPHHSCRFLLDTEPYDPPLQEGGRLGFSLRVNATCSGPGRDRRGRRKKTDIVMREMLRLSECGCVRERRLATARAVAPEWLASQGLRSGFAIASPAQDVVVNRYHVMRAVRPTSRAAVFGVLDLEGVLQVTDPVLLAGAVAAGFGRAKAFGCGLMLLGSALRTQG